MIFKVAIPARLYWLVIIANVACVVINIGILASPGGGSGINAGSIIFNAVVVVFYALMFAPKRGWRWE